MKTKMLLVASALAVSGCATHPDKMQPASVSDVAYKNHSCEELAMEAKRINARLGELYEVLRADANNDNAQMVVGSLIFFPALFFLEGGNGPEASEYARLRGESEAIHTIASRKECGLDIKAYEAPTPYWKKRN